MFSSYLERWLQDRLHETPEKVSKRDLQVLDALADLARESDAELAESIDRYKLACVELIAARQDLQARLQFQEVE